MEHNKAGQSFTLAMNELGDFTSIEYEHFMLGARSPGNETNSGGSTFLPPTNVKLPDTVDWRTHGFVTPVKNQGKFYVFLFDKPSLEALDLFSHYVHQSWFLHDL